MATAVRTLRASVLVVCSALMVSFAPSSSSVSASSCAELVEWARPLAGTTPTLDDMGRYDRAHRRALFSVLTPTVQAALWREQIVRFSELPALSPMQRALAREGIALHTPALYQHEVAARQAYAAFWQHAAGAFGDSLSQRAWFDLGALATSSAAAAGTGQTYCDCKAGGGTGQCGGVSCGGGSCTLVSGCGASGLQTCDGMCQF